MRLHSYDGIHYSPLTQIFSTLFFRAGIYRVAFYRVGVFRQAFTERVFSGPVSFGRKSKRRSPASLQRISCVKTFVLKQL